MNLFKTFTLRWWQASLFKISMLAAGIAIGAYWSSFFLSFLGALIVVAVVAGTYVTIIWWRQ